MEKCCGGSARSVTRNVVKIWREAPKNNFRRFGAKSRKCEDLARRVPARVQRFSWTPSVIIKDISNDEAWFARDLTFASTPEWLRN